MNEKTCEMCGQVLPGKDWKGLAINQDGDVFWRGIKKVGLPNMQAAILRKLIERGGASMFALEMITSENNRSNSVTVHISHLRRVLARYSIPVGIFNMRERGYILELHE